MDASTIETKWRERWAKEKAYESDPMPGKEKRYITAAFPYPNSPQHIGHARTYTTADIYARYLRLKGFHVLFPMGFHVTGTPILAMAKRIAAKEKDVLEVYDKIYGIPPEKAATLTDPRALVSYFSAEIEEGMKEMGYSIDWRRKFYSYDESFNKFIQWQFRKLKELGYIIKGEYPIAWCLADKNAVSAHDTRGDVDPELEDITVIKFKVTSSAQHHVHPEKSGKGEFLVATTYRPETVYGVTNIWANPSVEYVRAKNAHGETLILSKKAVEQLDLQLHLEVLGSIKTDDILKMSAINPVTKDVVPVWPAAFVKSDKGTGIVMSVPAHAPLDYLAIRDLGKSDIRMPQVVSLEGYGPAPAKDAVENLGVKDQNDPLSETATEEIYTKEAHSGIMAVGEFKGQKAIDAKEKIAAKMKSSSDAFNIVTIGNGPVTCRCGSPVVVNILKDQWFIDYGVPAWKAATKECLSGMRIIPEKSRSEYLYTIDWFKTRPCTRAAGLGTRFPFDETKMIEALSDSTIYMAFYTIAHLLGWEQASKIDDRLFDFVILGKGEGDAEMKKMRESFLYWYPVDSRHSAGDLVRNHLSLYMFNHVALMEKRHWPKQIVTNGFVLMDGAKMSKSMGNILPLRKAIKEYGADVIRFSVVSGAELSSDTDFNRTVADGVRSRMGLISALVEQSAKQPPSKPHGRAERWLLSRLNRKVGQADRFYTDFALRELSLEIFYDVVSDLQWYMKRSQDAHLREFFLQWVRLIAPFMPHYAEEYWEMLGGKGLVSLSEFPKPDMSKIDDSVELGEELVHKVHADIEKISTLIGKRPQKVTLFVAGAWKRKLYAMAKAKPKFEELMKSAAAEKMPMKDVPNVTKQLMKNVHALPDILTEKEELEALNDAAGFLAREYSCEVAILPEEGAKHEKARSAMPGKPAIVLE